MDIKSEIEIKMEELVSENDFSEDYQSFPHIESNISLQESIKEELDQMASFTIKSEAGESEMEFGIDEEHNYASRVEAGESGIEFGIVEEHNYASRVEAGELEIEFGIDEEQVIKSENPAMITKKFNVPHVRVC
ncbi:UNVERIFIED_CONTAM: hypothetical protein RMT77_014143 [Armadillidium vulgare]